MSNFVDFESKTANPENKGVFDISPEELMQKKGSVTMIDVRREDEYTGELGHIPGAKHLLLDQLPMRINEVSKEHTTVFVCRSGARSGRATNFAMERGYTSVYNLKGGMILWNEKNLPIEK